MREAQSRTAVVVLVVALEHDAIFAILWHWNYWLLRGRDGASLVAQQRRTSRRRRTGRRPRLDVLLHGRGGRRPSFAPRNARSHVAQGQAVLLDGDEGDLRLRVERRQGARVRGRALRRSQLIFCPLAEVGGGDAREAPPVELDGSFGEFAIREELRRRVLQGLRGDLDRSF